MPPRLLACLGTLLLAAGAAAQAPVEPDPSPAEIERLVTRLGSDDFHEREAAFAALRDIADLALPHLRHRLTVGNAELRLRAQDLITLLEKSSALTCLRGHKGDVLGVALLPGDRVKIELSPYDLDRGRITYRHK